MKFSFIPKEKVFYDLLEALAMKMQETVLAFRKSILAWDGSFPGVENLRKLEHECDEIVRTITLKLNKTFVTPIDAEDIHLLCKTMDDLVDIIHAITERLVLFQIVEIREDFKVMSQILEESTKLVVQAVHKIRKMENISDVLHLSDQVGKLEKKGDRAFELGLSTLFSNGTDPLDVIKWKEIYDSLEEGIDICEDIADIVEGIVVKYG